MHRVAALRIEFHQHAYIVSPPQHAMGLPLRYWSNTCTLHMVERAPLVLVCSGESPEELWTRKTQKAGVSTNSRQQQVERVGLSARARDGL